MFDKVLADRIRYGVTFTITPSKGEDIVLEYEGESYEQFLIKVRAFQQQVENLYQLVEKSQEVPF